MTACLLCVSFALLTTTMLLQVHLHLMPLAWETQALQSISPEQGHAFIAPLPTPRWSSHNAPSPAQVLEDGKQLGPGNAPHEEIRSKGEGRYSYWHDSSGNGRLYFASSDNSDPRANGRGYEARTPLVVGDRVQWPLYGLTVLGWILALSYTRSRRVLVSLAKHAIWLAQLAALSAMRAARMADRAAGSFWLSGIAIVVSLSLCLYRESSLSAVSMNDPGTWHSFLPAFAHAIGTAARDGHTTAVIAVMLVLLPAYRAAGRLGSISSLGSTVVLFLLPLLSIWSTGHSDGFIIGGLLPWSDAHGYYWDANSLLEGGSFSYFSSRRPLFPGMLATILGLTQHNLQVTLVVIAVIAGISCFLAAREVAASHGAVAGVAVLMLLFLFSREFSGTTSTENLGISLGAAAFAVLWRGTRKRRVAVIWVGMFLLTLALNARAGAFFVLPALILWGAWCFRGSSPLSLRFLLGGSGVVVLGFLLNLLLLRLVGSGQGDAFANFAMTIYGQVVGGKGWGQITIDHPELSRFGEPQYSREVYRFTWETFRADPSGLVVGTIKAYTEFFDPASWGAFSFVYVWYLSQEAWITHLILYALSGVGLIVMLARWRDPSNSMMLAAVGGIVLSVPFVPPIDSQEMRAYAATIPVISALPVLGLLSLFHGACRQLPTLASEKSRLSGAAVAFGLALALFCLIGPVVTRGFGRPPDVTSAAGEMTCQSGQEPIYLRYAEGSFIQLVEDGSISQSYLPRVRLSDFRLEVSKLGFYPDFVREFKSMGPGKTILVGLDLLDPVTLGTGHYGQLVWLVADSASLPESPGVIGACATLAPNKALADSRFYHAESIQSISTRR